MSIGLQGSEFDSRGREFGSLGVPSKGRIGGSWGKVEGFAFLGRGREAGRRGAGREFGSLAKWHFAAFASQPWRRMIEFGLNTKSTKEARRHKDKSKAKRQKVKYKEGDRSHRYKGVHRKATRLYVAEGALRAGDQRTNHCR
jgi:hypothetical protein